MDDLISRQAAIKEIIRVYEYEYPTASGVFDEFVTMIVPNVIKNLPAADLSEYCDKLWKTAYERGKEETRPKKGKWVCFANEGGELDLRCSVCGEEQGFFFGYFNYCPNCGAKMEE